MTPTRQFLVTLDCAGPQTAGELCLAIVRALNHTTEVDIVGAEALDSQVGSIQVTVLPEAAPLWAAFAGSAYGQEITLHETEVDALRACVDAFGLDKVEHGLDRHSIAQELRAVLDQYCNSRADDWHVNEVELPK